MRRRWRRSRHDVDRLTADDRIQRVARRDRPRSHDRLARHDEHAGRLGARLDRRTDCEPDRGSRALGCERDCASTLTRIADVALATAAADVDHARRAVTPTGPTGTRWPGDQRPRIDGRNFGDVSAAPGTAWSRASILRRIDRGVRVLDVASSRAADAQQASPRTWTGRVRPETPASSPRRAAGAARILRRSSRPGITTVRRPAPSAPAPPSRLAGGSNSLPRAAVRDLDELGLRSADAGDAGHPSTWGRGSAVHMVIRVADHRVDPRILGER